MIFPGANGANIDHVGSVGYGIASRAWKSGKINGMKMAGIYHVRTQPTSSAHMILIGAIHRVLVGSTWFVLDAKSIGRLI
jgi:hypothetical protein